MATIIQTILFLCLAWFPTGEIDHARLRQLPDSVNIRVFAGYRLKDVAIGGSGLVATGGQRAAPSSTSIRLSAESSIVRGFGGSGASCRIASTDGGPITLSAQDRRRMLRGVLTVIAHDSELIVIAREPLREYLVSVLATEASPKDPSAYLVALSVLQRNYIMAHPHRHAVDGADLCDNTHCQRSDLSGVTPRMYAAVDDAMHIVMMADSSGRVGDGVFPCYYSVNCGGSTLLPSQVWKGEARGYSNVLCPHCINSPNRRWQRTTPATEQTDAIVRTAPKTPFVDDNFKTRLGRAVGFNVVRSNTILSIERRGTEFVITGSGFGHRVGLCQEGALQLARDGRSAVEILRFYFPSAGVSLSP